MGKSYDELLEELDEKIVPSLVNEIHSTLTEQGYSELPPKSDEAKDKTYTVRAIDFDRWKDKNFDALVGGAEIVTYIKNPTAKAADSLKEAFKGKGFVISNIRTIAARVTRIVWQVEVATS